MADQSSSTTNTTPNSTDNGDSNNNATGGNNSTPAQAFSDEFKTAVRDYCAKDDQRLNLNKQLTGIKKDIKELELRIIKHMEQHNLPLFDTKDKGMFQNTVEQKAKGLSKEVLLSALSKCGQLKDPAKAEEVVNFIYESRPVEKKNVLKRKV
jgi:hypothetical protein